jgi:predicted GNAT family N-acyltransferase
MLDLTESRPAESVDLTLLRAICKDARFKPGDVVRRKGQHYRDMFLLTEGCVEVDRGLGVPTHLVSGFGSPIGEISYLQGCPATATVSARTAARALVIDDATLARLEQEEPALTADLMRRFADTAEERLGGDLSWDSKAGIYVKSDAIQVYLCRDADTLDSAKRLRYEVYCQELGRQSPYADHDKKMISDHLDETGLVFIAVEGSEVIGTLRANTSAESELGSYEELYGMKKSVHHPEATGICTKFIVKKARRGSPAAMKLMAAVIRYGLRNNFKECYIDCIPALLPYYKAIGFTITGQKFVHRENGPSYPMMLDLVKYGGGLVGDWELRTYLKIILKAKAIKWIDSVRRYALFTAPR